MRAARFVPLVALLLVPALAHAATTHEVVASGSAAAPVFTQASVTVAVGDTVHWTSTGPSAHNVHFVGEAAALTDPKPTGDLSSRTFAAAGTFTYYCDLHGSPTDGMRGTVVVTGGGGTSPTPTATPDPTATVEPTATPTPAPPAGTPPAKPAVGALTVTRRVKGGKVRGSVKVTPAGTTYTLTVRARGHRVGRAERTATGKAQAFAVRLAKDARKRLVSKGALQAKVTVAAGDVRRARSLRLRPPR